jgi:hypothetical protein
MNSNEIKSIRDRVIDVDFTDFEYSGKDLHTGIICDDMRIGMGLVYSAEGWKKKRDRVLKTPLP